MSFSNPTPSSNPSSLFLEWKSDEKTFTYWNGEARVPIKLPFKFVVLDQLTTIKGWSDKDQSGIWSNEVRDTNAELAVQTKSGVIAKGNYKELKDKVKNLGGKYVKSVYACMFADNKYQLVNLQIKGAALSPWIEAKVRTDDHFVITAEVNETPQKKGATTYYIPQFKANTDLPKEWADKCQEFDIKLQNYLSEYFQPVKEVAETPKVKTTVEALNKGVSLPEVDVDDLNVQMPF